jgi:glycosyltransferase involved in cell wall biosynthesis
MTWSEQCAAVIPCLNEAASIGPLVKAVRREVPTVLVVDDGSNDGSAGIASEAGATVLRNAVIQGKGAALQQGWQHARDGGFTWALTLDGDGQHAPEEAPTFFRCVERTGAWLVVGNRMTDATRMPWLRRVTNQWMSRQLSLLAGQSLPDTQCGYRLVNLESMAKLRITSEHFEIESEVLLAFVNAGLRVEFVPIRTIYKNEQSKMHPWRDTIRWLRWRRHARHSYVNLHATDYPKDQKSVPGLESRLSQSGSVVITDEPRAAEPQPNASRCQR